MRIDMVVTLKKTNPHAQGRTQPVPVHITLFDGEEVDTIAVKIDGAVVMKTDPSVINVVRHYQRDLGEAT